MFASQSLRLFSPRIRACGASERPQRRANTFLRGNRPSIRDFSHNWHSELLSGEPPLCKFTDRIALYRFVIPGAASGGTPRSHQGPASRYPARRGAVNTVWRRLGQTRHPPRYRPRTPQMRVLSGGGAESADHRLSIGRELPRSYLRCGVSHQKCLDRRISSQSMSASSTDLSYHMTRSCALSMPLDKLDLMRQHLVPFDVRQRQICLTSRCHETQLAKELGERLLDTAAVGEGSHRPNVAGTWDPRHVGKRVGIRADIGTGHYAPCSASQRGRLVGCCVDRERGCSSYWMPGHECQSSQKHEGKDKKECESL